MAESPDFQWRDLSAEEVYYLAHQENEDRYKASEFIGSLAFTADPIKTGEQWSTLLNNTEMRARSWFSDQAMIRNLEAQLNAETQQPSFQQWLKTHIASSGLTARSVAESMNMLDSDFSVLCNTEGRQPRRRMVNRVAQALANLKQLEGEEREAFFIEAARFLPD